MGPPSIGKPHLSRHDRLPYTQPEQLSDKICMRMGKGSSGVPRSQPTCQEGKLSFYKSKSRIEKLIGGRHEERAAIK